MGDIHSIYKKTYNFVYLRAKSVLKKEEDIQQLMKEVYVKAAKSTSLREDNMYEWLGKRTYVLGCQKYRKKKVREADIIELSEQEYRMKESVDGDRTANIIKETMEQLPDMYQATIYALYYDGMKIKDISTVMGYSVGAIVNRINYVHKYFIKAIQINQDNEQTKVLFSTEAVHNALAEWTKENGFGEVAAQNLYMNICKELGEEMQEVMSEEDNAGKDKRIVKCDESSLEVVLREFDTYRTKPFLSKQKIRILVLAAAALTFLILLGILVFGGESEEAKTNVQEDVEVNGSDVGTDVETDVEVDAEVDVETDVEADVETETETDVQTDSEYLIPNSDTVKLTRADLADFSAEELRIARNEIFARYGTIFGADDLKNHFSSKSWYNPRITFDEFYELIEMNAIEEANLALILAVEEEISE